MFQFTVLSISDAGKFQGSNRWRKLIWDTFNRPFESFYCIDHKLLIAKLYEYDISSSALNTISSYLKHKTQRTKIKDCFTTRSTNEYDVPQESILGPLLFLILI